MVDSSGANNQHDDEVTGKEAVNAADSQQPADAVPAADDSTSASADDSTPVSGADESANINDTQILSGQLPGAGDTVAYPAPTPEDYAAHHGAAAYTQGVQPDAGQYQADQYQSGQYQTGQYQAGAYQDGYAAANQQPYDQTYAQAPGYANDGYAYGGSPVPGLSASETVGAPAAGAEKKSVNKAVVAGIVAGLVAGFLGGLGGVAIGSAVSGGTVYSSGTQYNPANPEGLSPRSDNSVAAIAKLVLPSTVTIISRSGSDGGTGSGFVYNSDGYIITNNHVISSAVSGGQISVAFSNQDPIPAKLVGRSVSYDIAVLKVEKTGLPSATLGNSDAVVIGDGAVAVGSPLGLEGTVTSGIISALRRPVTAGGQGEASFISALQTDAPINPGNSGGPLVNAEGQVIGVNSAIATLGASSGGQTGSIGLGFAIPINNAKRIADEIISTGQSTVPIIGVQPNVQYDGTGAQVAKVEPGSPAAAAGIQDGDVITAVNGKKISGPEELLSAIRANQPGQDIVLTISSPSGGTKDVTVKLGSRTE
jgi:putative serine protease PepD